VLRSFKGVRLVETMPRDPVREGALRLVTTVLLAAALSACHSRDDTDAGASVPPNAAARSGSPKVVGRRGELSSRQAARTLEKVATESESPANVRTLIDEVGRLGDEPLYKDNAVDLLIDGPSTYRSMLEAIRAARDHIHLETYIFASDEIGREFAAALMERRGAGVAVRVLYDALGSFESEAAFFQDLESAGVEIAVYRALDDPAALSTLNTRDHRKILVVDGTVAFTGGINVSRTYSSSSGGSKREDPVADGWRDTHIRVEGPAVAGFQQLFLANWRAQGKDLQDRGSFFPPPTGRGEELLQILQASGVERGYSPIYHAYLRAMELATERIWITQAYFAPDERFLDTLRQAARRGVDVRVLVPGVTDIDMILFASRARYGELLYDGVRLFETQDTVLHAKTAVIDGIWSTVGSSNLDYRSFLHNDEVNAIVLGARFGQLMESQFSKDAAAAKPVLLEEWRHRPLRERALETLSRVVDYWL
jgi:cardiolipin synthase